MKAKDIIGLGVLAIGAGGVTYWLMNRNNSEVIDTSGLDVVDIKKDTLIMSPKWPLREGSQDNVTSERVKVLQEELIKKGGITAMHINTTGGADGKWGKGTSRAVKAAGWPMVIDEAKYNNLVLKISNRFEQLDWN